MLTRSRSKKANRPVFIDDKWNDAYIQTKDEQIDAMLAADDSQRGWDELEEENSDASDEDDDDDDDAWHSDSDESEDDEADWLDRLYVQPTLSLSQRWVAGGNLLQNVGWTLATLGVAPLLLYVSLPRTDGQLWPLQSQGAAGMLCKVALNVATLAVAAGTMYGAACSVERLTMTSALNWRLVEVDPPLECGQRLLHGGKEFVQALVDAVSLGASPTTPLRRLDEDIWTLVTSLDAPVVRELAGLMAAAVVTLTCFHRVWAKTLVLLTAASYVAFNVATEVKIQQRAAVEIFSLDPTFAFVNESIFIAIDGQNLEEGGSVAWAPYWGGLQQLQAHTCPKRFPQQLSNGGVLVTFGQVNEYVPCYLSAKETASAVIVDGEIQPSEAFQCFESIRLRVKDQKSVPGWSLHQHQQEEEPYPTEKQEL